MSTNAERDLKGTLRGDRVIRRFMIRWLFTKWIPAGRSCIWGLAPGIESSGVRRSACDPKEPVATGRPREG